LTHLCTATNVWRGITPEVMRQQLISCCRGAVPDDSVRGLSGGAGAAWAEAGTRGRELKSMVGHTEASPLS
jgi:hypothetical protein